MTRITLSLSPDGDQILNIICSDNTFACNTTFVSECSWEDIKEGIIVYPASNYMLKVNNRNTRTRCEICLKLTIKTTVFIVNFEHIFHLILLSLLLTLSR